MLGTTLGPYRIDAELGSGGMGKVYAATVVGRCPGLAEGTRVALKVVHPHLLDTPGFFKRFLREAEIGKAVVHENVVQTHDADAVRHDGEQLNFLVMEYVEGQTLRDLLRELDRVPEELCRHIGREVAKGLAAIHAAGVVHRDMKPENVLITKEHVVKVMDLGVARLNDEALRLSQTGAFVGSIHYAAPECFSQGGKHVDGRADLHALGLVLYELACGTNPYFADDVPQILKRVLHEEPRRLGDVNPQLSPFFEELVHCLLAKKPADRFADAASLLGVLEDGEKSAWWTSRSKAIRAETHQPLRRIRIPRETAVYGRESDIAKLRALFEKAKAGDGQVVVVEGEAGIGKSRVVDELIGRLQRDGENLNFLSGSYPPGGAATAAGAFSTAFREQFGDADLAESLRERLGVASALAPAFAALLVGTAAPTGAEPLTKDSLQTCFVAALRSLATDRTTVLLIDDLHFATEDARSLFTSLSMAVPGHRVLLVGTTRPGIDEKWVAGLTRLPQTNQMSLHRLGPKDLAALLADTLKSEALANALGMQIGVKSDGNPFFVFEIIRGLRDGRFLTQKDDGTWVRTRVIDDIQIPSSILDLVNARVADLTEDERAALDVAACWGFEFDAGLVGEVLGRARIPALRAFGQIERQHRLVRSSGRSYVFDHHQVQEALYGSINEQLREEYHAALASALETRTKSADKDPTTLDGALCVDLCEHFLKGYPCVAVGGAQGAGTVPDEGRGPDSPGASRAVPRSSATALPTEHPALRYLAAAHAHLEKGYLSDAAVRLAERALAVPGLLAGVDRAKSLQRLCGVLHHLGRRKRQEEAAREAERLAEATGDLELRWRAKMSLGDLFNGTGLRAEAEVAYHAALETAKVRGDRKAEAAAENCLGLVFQSQGRLAEAKEKYERCLPISREIGNRHGDAVATGNLGAVLVAQGRLAEAKDPLERSISITREIGNRQSEARATGNLGALLHAQGRLAEARDHQQRSLTIFREIGNRQGEAIAQQNLGSALRDAGDAAGSEERYLLCLGICEEIGDRHVAATTHVALGSLWASLSDLESARASFTAARDLAHAARAPGPETLARCELSLLPGGDPSDALSAFTAHEERLDAEERLEARHLLWRATGDRTHLVAAKRLLDDAVANVDAETRASMLTNLRVNREIAAAAKAAGL